MVSLIIGIELPKLIEIFALRCRNLKFEKTESLRWHKILAIFGKIKSMERFLSQCAKYISKKHENSLHRVCLVFPNRRAGVFFSAYLQKEISKPVIAPEITTISELLTRRSGLIQPDKLELLIELYNVYRLHIQTTESFDDFYFWGEMLLADFNDIDHYLVNAKDLFSNIADLKEIETGFDYLSNEQKKALEQFWGSIVLRENKEYQKNYIKIWKKLFPVYDDFRKRLLAKNLGYNGMIGRSVVEEIEKGNIGFDFDTCYFIGLNAINECEKRIMKHLQQSKKASFLWDFDRFYLDDPVHEAGFFLRENLTKFPPPADFDFEQHSFSIRKNISLVAVSSVYGQAQQIPAFFEKFKDEIKTGFDDTAIVLADESLLYPALSSIPPEIGEINITMGYPIKNSVVYGFIMLLINLLRNRRNDAKRGVTAYYRFVTDILNHQLLSGWAPEKNRAFLSEIQSKNKISVVLSEIDYSPLHRLIFSLPCDVSKYPQYLMDVLDSLSDGLKTKEQDNRMLSEIIYSVYQSLLRLNQMIVKIAEEHRQSISDKVFFRLLTQYIGSTSVAFEGEPLSGIQVMGILETRCLDFKNLVILGLNEDKWPRTFTAPSFIPANIRRGFGLPGIDEQDAMYSYYFYRLLQRSENISATYSVVKEGISTGELSRYGQQLIYDSPQEPEKLNLVFPFTNDPVQPIHITADKAISESLIKKFSGDALSPSAINTYLACSLRFYYKYVMDIKEPDEVQEEIDGAVFGNIFHAMMEELYKPFEGKTLHKIQIGKMLEDKVGIENLIARKMAKLYFKMNEEEVDQVIIEGKPLLFSENLKTYLYQLLKFDMQFAPLHILSLERKIKTSLTFDVDGVSRAINIGGKTDRIDKINGITRIIDYKTGTVESTSFKETGELFRKNVKKPQKEILQAMIYTWIQFEETGEKNIIPAIYDLKNLFNERFDPNIKLDKNAFSFEQIKDDFIANLKELLGEIFSANNSFGQTPVAENCEYCAYKPICQRYSL